MTSEAPILMVMVLYRTAIAQSKTLAGLTQAMSEDPALLRDFDLLVWDNSPAPLDATTLPFSFRYHHATSNVGVSGAYNAAATLAHGQGAKWLLLLDQDTTINGDFLRGMRRHAKQAETDARIAAVAPYLCAGDFVVSPRLWRFARHVPLPRPTAPAIELRPLFAANSGALMRVDALDAIGGYSRRFWLDYSDIDLFHRLHDAGFGVQIASDLALQHEVALLDYDSRMSPERYATYLAAESDFLDLYRSSPERLLHLPRLAVRALRQRRACGLCILAHDAAGAVAAPVPKTQRSASRKRLIRVRDIKD